MNQQINCLICERIKLIRQNRNPYFVRELETGYVVVGDYQYFKGYSLFLCKQHKGELHELEPDFRKKFLWEMSQVAEAVHCAFGPDKLNYELLGNSDAHMHWHLFPRYQSEVEPGRTVWTVDKKIREAAGQKPDRKILEILKKKLDSSLMVVLKKPLMI